MLYNLQDTITAISTPPGSGAIGIVRLCGPDAVAIAGKFFRAAGGKPLSALPSHTLSHGWIHDAGGAAIDEVLVSLMLKPRSYTGEDMVEFSAHAGPVVLKRILEVFLAGGARLAGPGEFTFRAFVNGKMDLARAEAVADLIASKTTLAHEAALSLFRGAFSEKIRGFRAKLTELAGALEAALDHAEEGIEFAPSSGAAATLAGLSGEIAQIIDTSKKLRFVREGLRAAIIGRPNAGKSSLLNALLERERAIVTDIPGTTRDVIEESIELKGFPLVLIDTAGLAEGTLDPVEKIGQERALEALKSAQIIVWVLDSSAGGSAAERFISGILNDTARGKIIIPVWNKTDLPFKADEKEILELAALRTGGGPAAFPAGIRLSVRTGSGLRELEDALVSSFVFSGDILSRAVTANSRHLEALRRTEEALGGALDSIKNGYSEEIPALHVREALSCLGEITGETATEEILESIFKNFCVGK